MAHPIPKYMGVTSFPYDNAKMSGKNLVSMLWSVGSLQHILCLIFNFANDLLMVYSKTLIKEPQEYPPERRDIFLDYSCNDLVT